MILPFIKIELIRCRTAQFQVPNTFVLVVLRGKLRRIIAQFGPYVWVDFDWKPLSSLGRWFSMLGIIAVVRFCESFFRFVLVVLVFHYFIYYVMSYVCFAYLL